MLKSSKKIYIAVLAALTLLTAACGQATSATPAATPTTVPVRRGNLDVTVSVDGNLNMPEAFNLHFGAPGDVKDVLVREGDRVKAGAILARLDDTSQRLDVMTSQNSLQLTLSNLYETVPRLPQFPTTFWDVDTYYDASGELKARYIEKPRWDWKWNNATKQWEQDPNIPYNTGLPVGYPGYYCNATALTAYNWAAEEVAAAQSMLASDNLTGAAIELYVATADLESSLKILEDAALNPASGLGNIEPFVPADNVSYIAFQIQQQNAFAPAFINEIRAALEQVQSVQGDIDNLRNLIENGQKEEALRLFSTVQEHITALGATVMRNINIIEQRGDTDIYGRNISTYLYNAASARLDAALNGIETGGLRSDDLASNLRISEHYMKLCNGILGTNDYVLQHGLSLKAENEYKINVEKNTIDLANKKDDFLKTVIMSPVDGIVVSVDVKKNDVLSQQDYSSKGTIQVVDTSQIKFIGTVDEIDILKIQKGQSATISIDAIPDRKFTGRVSFISPFGATATGGVVKFNVTVLLDPTDVDLKGGLTATADIAIQHIEDALLLPVTAVTTDSEGSFVNVATDNGTKSEKRNVTLGAQTQQVVQILDGVSEGERVLINQKATGVQTRTTMGPPPGGGGPPPR